MEIREFIKSNYFIRQDGIFTTNRGNTRVTPQIVMTKYTNDHPSEAMQLAPMAYQQAIDAVFDEAVEASARRAQELVERASEFAQDEDGYIKGCLDDENITPNSRYSEFKVLLSSGEYKLVDTDAIDVILKGRLAEYNRSLPEELELPRFNKDGVIDRFRYMCQNATNNALSKLHQDLRYDKKYEQELDAWVDELMEVMYTKTDRDVAKVAIKHMMWQVKRRLYGKGVTNDLWVAWYGAQGKGKSYIMRHCIFKIMEDFYTETQLSKVDDIDREIRKFSTNFVANFEELAVGNTLTDERSNKVNVKTVNNLKSILTSDKLYIRQMGGQNQLIVRKTFVPVSTANEHLYDVIYDESGMRRFFEIDLQTPPGLTTFDTSKVAELAERSIDAWRGICEWDDKPVWDWNTEVGKKILAIQGTYKPHTNINDWLDASNYAASETSQESAKTLYRNYKNYCKEYGYNAFGMKKFTDSMKKEFKFENKTGRGVYFNISTIAYDVEVSGAKPTQKKEML